ncbi:transglutaminase family protein [Segetibacter sp. 3557_3]|uniref:transglutaminase family protein n=1 Tax=Segetibacter sp. 3557_3 TaxID=2547429 RepID=UPI001058F118|nr:transglutaminase family protein [Segetibacter sp. 3557_3]TDH26079.1 transglutaminase family protein [Segetibacter sp. 3557_3]
MASYKIIHVTRYTYASTVIDCTNQVMLYPIVDTNLEVKKHEVKISHNPVIETFVDYFGNYIGVFSVIKPHTELLIESIADVETKPVQPPIDGIPAAEQWQHLYDLKDHVLYMDFLTKQPFPSEEEVRGELNSLIDYSKSPLQNGQALSSYVYNNFNYQKGVTNVETPTEEVWRLKAGVCQDFAHILLVFLRMYDIPARYISGYICPKDKEMRGEGATHAWVEAHIPGYGWLGLDPTNNCIVNDRHVRLAVGRNFYDCTPVKGTYKGSGEHTLEVSVEITNGNVRRSEERPTLPVFNYQAKNPGEPINSYRHYLEVQQKQQQQQQQQ